MNKEERKKLIQDYKRQESKKSLESGDLIIAHIAQLQLGLSSAHLTVQKILTTLKEQLIDLIYYKIEEVAEKQFKADPKKFKTREDVFKLLPFHIQAIYFSHQLEMLIAMGDCNKFFENSIPEEIEIVAKSYRLFGFQSLGNLALGVLAGNYDVEAFEQEFTHLKDSIQEKKIDFIRENAGEFELT